MLSSFFAGVHENNRESKQTQVPGGVACDHLAPTPDDDKQHRAGAVCVLIL